MSAPDLRFASLRAAYRERRLTPRALFATLREQALALNDEFRLYIHPLDAAEAEPYLAALDGVDPVSLPLYGLPFAIKDNIDLAGVPTTAACPGYAYVPERSAGVVARLVALGAMPTGKTNLDQFATGLNGQRSPYGGCRNSVLPDYPSGGSSSGSALAVALGLASFALGTDTAGSGRVPAALNGLIGCKPTRGRLPNTGVVPACASLDCVSLFTRETAEARELLALASHVDAGDPYSRAVPATAGQPLPGHFRFGLPRRAQRQWLGCTQAPRLFEAAVERLVAIGGEAVEIDFEPFYAAARLLYEGPWTAERYAAFGEAIERRLDGLLPVIRDIVAPGAGMKAVEVFRAQHRLQACKAAADHALEGLAAVVMPTYARAPTIAELHAEPIRRNSELGLYTNFVNLLDYAALALPAGRLDNGLPWGITLFGEAFGDERLLALAARFLD